MSVESDVFISANFIAAGTEVDFFLFGGGVVDDAFWDVSLVPQGTNNEIEMTRVRIFSDAGGTRTLVYTARNNSANNFFFTRSAVRTPNF